MNKKSAVPPLPPLDIDAVLSPDGLRMRQLGERRVVWALMNHLKERGFTLSSVHDTEDETFTTDPKEAMELVFNLDEVHLFFKVPGQKKYHRVYLVMGNSPEEVIADWTFSEDDATGFNAVMNAFEAEAHM